MDTNHMKKEQGGNVIELDRDRIKNDITNSGTYEEDGVKLKNWEGEADTEFYVGSLVRNNTTYLGVLNSKLKRQNFGYNKYDNGDSYFGYFDNDVKSKHGCYFYTPTIDSDLISQDIYYGFWNNNKKDHHGLYIWLTEKNENIVFEDANFDAYVGDIEDDTYKKGCYLTKNEENYYVYYGSFDADGRKNDDRAFFYSSKQDRVFRGKILDDRFVTGHLAYFDENGNCMNIVYAELNEKDEPTKVVKQDEINPETKAQICREVMQYRNLLLDEDYFGQIYQNVKEMKNFVKENMNSVEILDDPKGYPKLMKLGAAYNNVKIYSKISKALN